MRFTLLTVFLKARQGGGRSKGIWSRRAAHAVGLQLEQHADRIDADEAALRVTGLVETVT